MIIRWNNGFFYMGFDLLRSSSDQPRYCVQLSWNDLHFVGRRPPELGDMRFADNLEVGWSWPNFDGVHFADVWRASWRDVK
jgi:hypothetical protein